MINIDYTTVNCTECDHNAEFVRHTQFAGSHPFCEKHAKAQPDFGKDNSYQYWEKLKEKLKEE